MKLVPRNAYVAEIERALKRSPVVALLGPRQCGKSTLARQIASAREAAYYDLEKPDDAARLQNPMQDLKGRKGLVVLDEIQRMPQLLPVLRVLADRRPLPARFLVLGSASLDLVRGSSESLAGRIEFVEMSGFDLWEVGPSRQRALWVRGGFPNSFLAKTSADSMAWRENFVRTFLERDIPQMGFHIPAQTLRQFWTMVAHYHAQVWNGAEIGRSLGMAHTSARRYLDLLCGSLVLRQIPPWFENLGKRVVKSPKVYVRDSGILHALLRVDDFDTLAGHPKLGASWEGFALEQVLRCVGERDVYFWATHAGAELDLLYFRKGKRYGVEFKYADAPALTKSMRIALDDLRLQALWVVYPGTTAYPLADRVHAVPLAEFNVATASAGKR